MLGIEFSKTRVSNAVEQTMAFGFPQECIMARPVMCMQNLKYQQVVDSHPCNDLCADCVQVLLLRKEYIFHMWLMVLHASGCGCLNSEKIKEITYLFLLQKVVVIYNYWEVLSWNSVFHNTKKFKVWVI